MNPNVHCQLKVRQLIQVRQHFLDQLNCLAKLSSRPVQEILDEALQEYLDNHPVNQPSNGTAALFQASLDNSGYVFRRPLD